MHRTHAVKGSPDTTTLAPPLRDQARDRNIDLRSNCCAVGSFKHVGIMDTLEDQIDIP